MKLTPRLIQRSARLIVMGVGVTLTVLLASCGGGGGSGEGETVVANNLSQKATCTNSGDPQALISAINTARAQARVCGQQSFAAAPPLLWDALLANVASAHADDMATRNYFSHTNAEGLSASQRALAAGYGPNIAENIGAGQTSAEAALVEWLASPEHCENIMNPAYRHYALACGSNANSDYGTYWVQNFGVKG